MDEQGYTITIEVEVTASSPEEAMQFAMDDLRDPTLFGWTGDVIWKHPDVPWRFIQRVTEARPE